MSEGKTLRELNVQPGDVVECRNGFHDNRLFTIDEEWQKWPAAAERWWVRHTPLPPGHVRLASGEAVDLTANRIAHGLLMTGDARDQEIAAAMEAHGGPYDIYTQAGWTPWQNYTINGKASKFHVSSVVRVRPAPVVQTVKRSLHGEKFMGYVAIDLINGEPDWSTMRKWEDAA